MLCVLSCLGTNKAEIAILEIFVLISGLGSLNLRLNSRLNPS